MPFDNQAYLEPAVDPAAEHNHILDEMKRVLDERGWCKGTVEHRDGRVCLLGAGAAAAVGKPYGMMVHTFLGRSVYHRLNEVAGTSGFVAFNNLPTTTRADIDALLEEARL